MAEYVIEKQGVNGLVVIGVKNPLVNSSEYLRKMGLIFQYETLRGVKGPDTVGSESLAADPEKFILDRFTLGFSEGRYQIDVTDYLSDMFNLRLVGVFGTGFDVEALRLRSNQLMVITGGIPVDNSVTNKTSLGAMYSGRLEQLLNEHLEGIQLIRADPKITN